LVVFFSPLGVFSFSLGSSGGDGFNSFVVVSVSLVKIDFSLLEDFGVIGDGLFEGSDGGSLFVDLLVEVSNRFVTNSLIGSVLGIRFFLFLGDFANDFVNQKGNFFKGG